MQQSSEEALRAIEAALTTQNHQFAAFVEAFNELPPDTRIDVRPSVLDALDMTSVAAPARATNTPVGALRA